MSSWPDPEKPGVPLTPERDGRHWLFDPENNKSYPEIWVAALDALLVAIDEAVEARIDALIDLINARRKP